jgi:hypothetical protein
MPPRHLLELLSRQGMPGIFGGLFGTLARRKRRCRPFRIDALHSGGSKPEGWIPPVPTRTEGKVNTLPPPKVIRQRSGGAFVLAYTNQAANARQIDSHDTTTEMNVAPTASAE